MESGRQNSSQTAGFYGPVATMTLAAAEALPDDPETLKAMLIA
jgi:hypothetical protein